jgi:uncharacterized membrane protein YgdD (TMEM256/DUF423 family)
MNSAVRISAISGFLAVALGAFGAHGLGRVLASLPAEAAAKQLAWWHTAVDYHLPHSILLFVIAVAAPRCVWAWRLLLGGIIIFSGSLYVMGATGVRWLGAITPVGGGFLLAGWALLAIQSTLPPRIATAAQK